MSHSPPTQPRVMWRRRRRSGLHLFLDILPSGKKIGPVQNLFNFKILLWRGLHFKSAQTWAMFLGHKHEFILSDHPLLSPSTECFCEEWGATNNKLLHVIPSLLPVLLDKITHQNSLHLVTLCIWQPSLEQILLVVIFGLLTHLLLFARPVSFWEILIIWKHLFENTLCT